MSEAENQELIERAMELEPAKRLSLATKLLDSVEEPEGDEWSEAWAAELDRRIQAMKDGSDAGESWESVRDAALAGLRGRRAQLAARNPEPGARNPEREDPADLWSPGSFS